MLEAGVMVIDPVKQYSKQEAFEYCRQLATTHPESFKITSWIVPPEIRPHLNAVYAFCRTADNISDKAEGDRMAQLDEWEDELYRCYTGEPTHPIFVALRETVQQFDIPQQPFLRLIGVNRMDQSIDRYQTFEQLLDYCSRSANPAGHIVLYLFGHRDVELQKMFDSTCTALQLTDFWQDVREDFEMGRVYLPQEDLARFEYTEDDLRENVFDKRFRDLMSFQVERTRDLYRQGLELIPKVTPNARPTMRVFSSGGIGLLNAIESIDFDVLHHQAQMTSARKIMLGLRSVLAMPIKV